MSTPELLLADFMDAFAGNIHNYGQHLYKFVEEGKEEGKNSTVTNKLLTIEQYKSHLAGKVGLGVIPVNDKGECKFAAIDVDVYDSNLNMYMDAIEAYNFPLIPFKSKSGGLHLFMFMKQLANVKAVLDVVNQLVAVLGIDLYIKNRLNRIVEVFPKQQRLGKNDVGSWINLPYFNAEDTRQYAIRGGKQLSLDSALNYIKEKKCSLNELRGFLRELQYADGPPCLQTINMLNIMDENSGRNNYLFGFAVYLKKKDPEFWEQRLFEINAAMKKPLPKGELESTIVNSLRKKDYTYRCLEPPCVDFCRKSLCKTREFGIGKQGGYFSELEYGRLFQIKAYEPYYEWEVRGQGEETFKMLRFRNEEEIIRQDMFLRLCFRELHVLPIKMKQSEWFKLINQALEAVEIKEVNSEDDTSPISIFRQMFFEFLTQRAPAQTKDQILSKCVYFSRRLEAYLFRVTDLNEYIFVSKGFKYMTPSELHGVLRDLGATPTRIKTETGRQLRVYVLAKQKLDKIMTTDVEDFKAEFDLEEKDF